MGIPPKTLELLKTHYYTITTDQDLHERVSRIRGEVNKHNLGKIGFPCPGTLDVIAGDEWFVSFSPTYTGDDERKEEFEKVIKENNCTYRTFNLTTTLQRLIKPQHP